MRSSIPHSSSIPLSHHVIPPFTLSPPPLWSAFASRAAFTATPPQLSLLKQLLSTLRHPATSPYLHRSLSPVLFPTPLLCLPHSPPSFNALLIALIPPLLTYTISPPYHTVPTLKLSFLTSLRHHAALSPLQNSGCRTENFLTPPLSLIFAPFLFQLDCFFITLVLQ